MHSFQPSNSYVPPTTSFQSNFSNHLAHVHARPTLHLSTPPNHGYSNIPNLGANYHQHQLYNPMGSYMSPSPQMYHPANIYYHNVPYTYIYNPRASASGAGNTASSGHYISPHLFTPGMMTPPVQIPPSYQVPPQQPLCQNAPNAGSQSHFDNTQTSPAVLSSCVTVPVNTTVIDVSSNAPTGTVSKKASTSTKRKAAVTSTVTASVAAAGPTSGSQGGGKKKSGTHKSSGNGVLPNTVNPPPPPILASDPRRQLTKNFLNTFNSCDLSKLKTILTEQCTENVVEIHRYEGVQNPYGRNFSRLHGRAVIVDLWSHLFKSAPDFFFDVIETRAFYSPEWTVVVASKFVWFGTRVADIRVTRPTTEAQAAISREKEKELFYDSNSTNTTAEVQASKEAVRVVVNESESCKVGTFSPRGELAEGVDESLFNAKGQGDLSPDDNYLELTKDDKIYLDQTPLAQKHQMRCIGTFLVFLDEANKVNKLEFVFTAVSDTPVA